jgi:hypothetical protein
VQGEAREENDRARAEVVMLEERIDRLFYQFDSEADTSR